MALHIDMTQWRDKTEPPAIVWAPISAYAAQPVAVDDSHGNDLYDELTRAWYAAGTYETAEELEARAYWYDLTPEHMRDLYAAGDGSAEAAGLPREYYAEGVNEDGSDAIIYVDEATEYDTSRESIDEAARYLDPEDVAAIYRAVLDARAAYDC